MVMSKVTLNVNAASGVQPQSSSTDNSFSDVLGGVNSERRQAGLSGSSQKAQGDSDSGFRYTERADSTNVTSDSAPVRNDAPVVTEKTVEAAEDMLSAAVEQLRKTISESDEDMSEYDILKLLMELIAKQKKQAQNADDTDEASAAELLMSMLLNIAQNADDNSEPVMTVPTETIAPVSEKSGEAAMLTSSLAVTPDQSEEQPVIMSEAQPEQTAEETVTFGSVQAAVAEVQVLPEEETVAAEEETVPVMSEAPEETAPEAQTETVKTDDNLAKLNDVLSKAKEELGLTKAVIRSTNSDAEQTQMAETVKPHETAMKLGSDKADELNTILNGREKEMPVEEETENTVHTETDNAVHMAAELIDRTQIADTRIPEQDIPVEHVERPPEVQTADEILSRISTMEGDRTEFTMVLNPESLGRITVKLVMTGERISLDISAENPETRQLLESRSENLQSMLRSNGVELEDYRVVTREEEAQQAMQQDSYDGSSRNPYGRQQQDQHGEDDDDNSFYELLQSI